MSKYITTEVMEETGEVRVREVIEAMVANGFVGAPRDDIQVGDVLTEYEQMLCGLIPWNENLVPAPEPEPEPKTEEDTP
jgi:hypothetical protein